MIYRLFFNVNTGNVIKIFDADFFFDAWETYHLFVWPYAVLLFGSATKMLMNKTKD